MKRGAVILIARGNYNRDIFGNRVLDCLFNRIAVPVQGKTEIDSVRPLIYRVTNAKEDVQYRAVSP